MARRAFAVLIALGGLGASACSTSDTQVPVPDAGIGAAPAGKPPRVLIYTKETEWIHPSTKVAAQVMTDRGRARGWEVTISNDSAVFTKDSLARFDVLAFLNSSGFTMTEEQRTAFATYIALGHGWVGAHAASHTDYDWPFMHELVGASFCCHPPIMPANLVVEAPEDPIVAHLPGVWPRTDEWYTFDRRPEDNPRLKILLTLDERSARPDYPGPDLSPVLAVGYHPVAWRQEFGATRSFYTALGHTPETWSEELFLGMMIKAIEWAARAGEAQP